MNLNKVEVAYIDNLREKGKTWQEIGIAFGMSDEAVRSLYRRSPRSTTPAPGIAESLLAIEGRLTRIEAVIEEYALSALAASAS